MAMNVTIKGDIVMSASPNIVDLNALKFNQLSIITLVVLGFVFNQPLLPAFVAVVLLGGSIYRPLALFKLIYKYVAVPLKVFKPNLSEESSAPHAFAQLLGGIFLAAGSILFLSGSTVAGWIFAWLVVFLALANVVFGFCAGCFVYFQLGKLGVPGFYPQTKH
jgi:hypothetical protein